MANWLPVSQVPVASVGRLSEGGCAQRGALGALHSGPAASAGAVISVACTLTRCARCSAHPRSCCARACPSDFGSAGWGRALRLARRFHRLRHGLRLLCFARIQPLPPLLVACPPLPLLPLGHHCCSSCYSRTAAAPAAAAAARRPAPGASSDPAAHVRQRFGGSRGWRRCPGGPQAAQEAKLDIAPCSDHFAARACTPLPLPNLPGHYRAQFCRGYSAAWAQETGRAPAAHTHPSATSVCITVRHCEAHHREYE